MKQCINSDGNAAMTGRRICQPCVRQRQRKTSLKYRQAHPDKQRASQARTYQKHRSQRLESAKEYRGKNKALLSRKNRQWMIENKERRKAYKRVYCQRNKEQIAAYINSRIGIYREQKRVAEQRRRVRATVLLGRSYTVAEWLALVAFYSPEGNCLRCEQSSAPLTADHVIPLSVGGSNDIGNIQPLCQRCNNEKHVQRDDYRFDKGIVAKDIDYIQSLRDVA